MPDPDLELQYNQDLNSLVELLSRVRRPGDFYATGSLTVPLPRLEIEGAGTISFPVPPNQARSIIQQAEQAPYGRGEETLVDPTVRKVWQVMPGKVRLGGTTWPQTFERILTQVAQGLGCPKANVSAELYKLLVYDAGGFFVSHRDTEKTKGMFGTLVVVLPSFHGGGELVVRHAGREVVLDLRTQDVAELNYAAFYADCEHEVRPITEGNRVCLIYNLIQPQAGKGSSSPLAAPDYESEVAAAAQILAEWANRPEAPPKLAYLLEHQYSPDGLCFSGLKNADAALGKVLAQASQRAGFAVHVGIVHIEESGSAEISYEPSYGRSRWRRRYEDEEANGDSDEDFEVIEVLDCRHYISDWVNLEDRPAGFGKVPLGEGELLPHGALDDEPPDEQRVMEATGNEGASFERAYHRAAIVLWREDKYPEVLLQGGVGALIPYLKDRVEEWSSQAKSSRGPELQRQAQAVAKLLVRAWEGGPASRGPFPGTEQQPDRAAMLELLLTLGDRPLLRQFIETVVAPQYHGSENAALAKCIHLLGSQTAGEVLPTLVEKNMPQFHGACVDLLKLLIERRADNPVPEWVAAQRKLATAAVQGLSRVTVRPSSYGSDWLRLKQAKPVDATMVADLMAALQRLYAADLAEQATASLTAHPDIFAPDTVIVPALVLLGQRQANVVGTEPALLLLWKHAAEFLLARSEFPPPAPSDWAQVVEIKCRCADCRELESFAANPVEQVHRFRVRQDRRQHLHGMIEQHGLDMTHTTERVGSPQTLVCTKTRRRYQARCEQYARDIQWLQTLVDVLGAAQPRELGALLKRVSGAIGRA